MRTRTVSMGLVLGGLLLSALAYLSAGTVQAQSGCAATYVVQRGDWLAAIARRSNTTVDELVRLNPHLTWRRHLIYVGETLCLPPAPPTPVPPTPPTPVPTREPVESLELELQYRVVPGGSLLPVYTAVGSKRTRLGLQGTGELTQGTNVTTTGSSGSTDFGSTPVLVAFGNAESAGNTAFKASPDFTLFEIGSPGILASLRSITGTSTITQTGCDAIPVEKYFDADAAPPVTLTAWLASENGYRTPFPITKVGLLPGGELGKCAGAKPLPAFAVMAGNRPEPQYWMAMRYRPCTPPPGGGCGSPFLFVCNVFGLSFFCTGQ